MSKQSSVEWLANQLFPDNEIFGWSKDLMQQAKAMHKQEIEEAFEEATKNYPFTDYDDSEDYYTQTFEQ